MQLTSQVPRADAAPSTTVYKLLLCVFAALGPAGAVNVAGGLRYSACVTDSGGQAIAGAVVEAYHHPEQGRRPDPELVTNLTTGADGKFEVVVPAYSELVVRKPGLAPAWREVRPDRTNNAPIVLSPPTTLAGVVVDGAGKPVSSAEVFVCTAHSGDKADWTAFLWRKPARQLFSSHTDANGHFQIENFPPSSLAELDVAAPGKVLPPRRVNYSPENLFYRSGQKDIRLVVETAVSIEGKIETETGEAVTNTAVELRTVGSTFAVPWEPFGAVTNNLFRFNGVAAGAYQICARFGTNEPPDWVAEPVSVTVQSGQNVADVDIRAIKGGILRASSTDRRTGKPMEGVYFTVQVGSEYLHATSGTNGLGLFRLVPGRYGLHGTKGGQLHQYAEVRIEAGQTNEAKLEFSSPPVVSGIVRDAGGNPAPGLSVWLHSQWPRKEIKTDANGRYEVVRNEDAKVVVVVDAVRDLAVSRELEEGVTNLDLRLAPALTVTGRVQDPQGKPISQAKVLPYLKSGTWGLPVDWQTLTTDAQGSFKLVHLPADRAYYLQINAKGYGSAQPKVPADNDRQIELPPAVLKPANLKISGQVVDASETPLAGARIYAYGNGQPNSEARSGPDGRFSVEAVEGAVDLSVSFEEMHGNALAKAGDTDVVIVVKPNSGASENQMPKRSPLVGKALPDLATVNLSREDAAAGKPVLLCLFDCEQRPSRQALRLLTEQNESLRQKGVTVLGIQAAVVTSEAFAGWKEATPLPFKIGRVTEKKPGLTWATEADPLPWLILVNSQGRVAAEGFSMSDLTAKIGALGK